MFELNIEKNVEYRNTFIDIDLMQANTIQAIHAFISVPVQITS